MNVVPVIYLPHQIISTLLEEILEKCCKEVHDNNKFSENNTNYPENAASEINQIMDELLDCLGNVDESLQKTSSESTDLTKGWVTAQDQQRSLNGVKNLSIDEENEKDIYEVMDFLLYKCCEIAEMNHTSDHINIENSTNVYKILHGDEKPKHRTHMNEDSWYTSAPDVGNENLTDDKIRKKSLPDNWDFKSMLLNEEGSIEKNHASHVFVENVWVKNDSGEVSNLGQGLNEFGAVAKEVCFNVNKKRVERNLVSHDLPSLRCLCKQVLHRPLADTQDVESLKSLALKFIEDHRISHCSESEKLKIGINPLKMKHNACLLKDHSQEEMTWKCFNSELSQDLSREIAIIENSSNTETKSQEKLQGNEFYHFELYSKDNQRKDCERKMTFIKYLGLSPLSTPEKEMDTDTVCSDAEQFASEILPHLQPASVENELKNYLLNSTEVKENAVREQDKVFELDLSDLQHVPMKNEAKDMKSFLNLSETKESVDKKQGTVVGNTEIQNALKVNMKELIPCKKIKLEDKEEVIVFQNHLPDEKQNELCLLAKMAHEDYIKEDSDEKKLDANLAMNMEKEKQSLVDTTMKDIKDKQDILSVGQSKSPVSPNLYQEKQVNMNFDDEEEMKFSECDKRQGNLTKIVVSDSIPELTTKDEDESSLIKEEGYAVEDMEKAVKSTEQIVPSTVNTEHTETYERESFYDEENNRCNKYKNFGTKETVLDAEPKDSVHSVFEPNTKCFKWKYTPSYDDMDAVVPDTEKEGHDLSCRILPISSCKKPIRLGLSRRQQRLASLHPYMKKEFRK